jgi:hypothetical protein
MKSISFGEDKGLKGAQLQIKNWSFAGLDKLKLLFDKS